MQVFLALVLVWNTGTISTEDALSGFSNPGVLAVGSLFVVIKGVERSRLADRAAKHVFGLRTTLTAGLLRLMGLAFLLSAFLNNTPVVALLIPITKDWAATRGFSSSTLLMPLSFACIFGGLVTIIGTSTNLVVQGLVIEAGQADPTIRGLGFFEPGYIGLPLGMVGMLYLVVAAPRVLARAETGGGAGDRGSGRDRGGSDGKRTEELMTEVTLVNETQDWYILRSNGVSSCLSEDRTTLAPPQKCEGRCCSSLLPWATAYSCRFHRSRVPVLHTYVASECIYRLTYSKAFVLA